MSARKINVGDLRSVRSGNASSLYTYFERLNERPEQYSYRVPLPEQFDQSGGPEQTEESNVYEVFLKREEEKMNKKKVCR